MKLSLRDGNTNQDMCKITSGKFIIVIAANTIDYVSMPNIWRRAKTTEMCSKTTDKQNKWEPDRVGDIIKMTISIS